MLKTAAKQTSKEDADFALLKKMIKTKLGFNCEYYKDSHFRRRIDVRIRATGSKNFGEYVQILKEDSAECAALLETLTVNVTNFFRNSEVYDIVEKEVLPAVISSKGAGLNRSIKIWSAGCSIGVEAYSIAMLFHHILGNNIKRVNISITGTDIDKASLQQAQQGIYSEIEMKDVRPAFIEKYFWKEGNQYRVNDELKKMIRFKSHDMISGPKMTGFDIIFCRNVTIYFEKELQEKLYMNFYEGLNENGFFVMGKTETLIGPSKDLFKSYNAKERIYAK
ncbi:MCP methyltransferase [Methanolobus halotolerans]|uniref:protein-glutamate O-methyltransferase n=2 Tax=Methanolobus halotolerans TaxID=2052935 RepID=A0A4E0R149_9EURY|nr:MCP methyltransferase [Methanolobus halotolerans]